MTFEAEFWCLLGLSNELITHQDKIKIKPVKRTADSPLFAEEGK